MTEHNESADSGALPSLRFLRAMDAIPYAISWATLPEGRILYSNAECDRLFGYRTGYFRTIQQFLDCVYLHEQQREKAREQWLNCEPPPDSAPVVISEMEVDVLTNTREILTVLCSGLILPQEGLAMLTFKELSTVGSRLRQLREMAHRDDLTGVFNRRGLRERWKVESTNAPKRQLAFLMLDLDHFKSINDSHGHAVGDAVLQTVAARLEATVRQTDMVCRLGGDEFGILLVAPEGVEQIKIVCERILKEIATPIIVGEACLQVGVSIGGCLYPDQAQNKREVLKRADQALYQLKKGGAKGSWRWFGDEPAPAQVAPPARSSDKDERGVSGGKPKEADMECKKRACPSDMHRQRSLELILTGIQACDDPEEQRIFLEALMAQCALLARVTSGDEAFRAWMKQLYAMNFDELERITLPATPF
jgi:diguanylate cyclase (GGDEF)-like protein